jgi:hypothetical protein
MNAMVWAQGLARSDSPTAGDGLGGMSLGKCLQRRAASPKVGMQC